MKRLIPIMLAIFLLTGCNSDVPGSASTENTMPVKLAASYQNSAIEKDTNGAIKEYALVGEVSNIEMLDKGLVLSNDQGRVGILSDNDTFFTSHEVENLILLSVNGQRVIGYDTESDAIIITDNSLNILNEFVLEAGVSGVPVAGIGTNEIYYCVESYIRALNLDTGLTRHVMQHAQDSIIQINCYFDGQIIGFNSGEMTTYLSSEDGQTLFRESDLRDFQTGTNCYYGIYRDGFVDQFIWGVIDGEPMQLIPQQNEELFPQMYADCVVSAQTSAGKTVLRRYEMSSGLCSSRIEVALSGEIKDVAANDAVAWILTDSALYRWDCEMTSNSSNEVYTIALINADNPDAQGLALCKERADAIAAEYGIDIHIWEDAILNNDTYVINGEYQVETINKMLDGLEQQLPQMPKQIFTMTAEYCGIQICLVRSIEGQGFIQYWADGGLCIAITPTADIEEALLTGLGWGIDSRVIGNSRDLDYWDELNPADFTYDYSYFVNAQRTDLQYLEGEYRAFTDQRAMSFPSEDRARIFYYSLLDGNEELFSSPVLQSKLKTFCEGIREAYGWQKDAESFPWEQYLDEPLAFTK